MKIFIIMILSIFAIGAGIAMLVPRETPHFTDDQPLNITFNLSQHDLRYDPVAFTGTLRKDDVSIDNAEIQKWISIDINKENSNIRLSITGTVPEDLQSISFNLIMAGGSSKQVILEVPDDNIELLADRGDTNPEVENKQEQEPVAEAEDKSVSDKEEEPTVSSEIAETYDEAEDTVQVVSDDSENIAEPVVTINEEASDTADEPVHEQEVDVKDVDDTKPVSDTGSQIEASEWPQPQGNVINRSFPSLKDPVAFKLPGDKTVYGQSRGAKVPFQVYKGKITRRSPACVYEFSDKDPVAEMYAIWSLGGRFMLTTEGSHLLLGDENSTIGPQIKDQVRTADKALALEVNNRGKTLLNTFCKAMGVPSGTLLIALPEVVWSAVYQTVDKVAVDNELKSQVSNSNSVVKWRLKNHTDGYAIIIQKADMTKK